MGVASGCGEQEVGVASGSGWNLWVWLLCVVVRRYIDFLILLIPTPLVYVLFCSSILHFLKMFFVLYKRKQNSTKKTFIYTTFKCYVPHTPYKAPTEGGVGGERGEGREVRGGR